METIITGKHFGPSETRTQAKIFMKTKKWNKKPLKMEKLPRILDPKRWSLRTRSDKRIPAYFINEYRNQISKREKPKIVV